MPEQARGLFKSGNRWLLWSGGLALTAIGGAVAFPLLLNRVTDPVSVSFVTVERGDIESSINEVGTVELQQQETIKSPIEGAVDQVMVRPGQRVQAGQILLTLRYPERQTALATQELQIQQHRLTLERNRQRLQEAREQLQIEQRQLDSLTPLLAAGAIPGQSYQTQEDRVRTARIAVRDAEATVGSGAIELQRSRLENQRILQQVRNSVITASVDGIVLDVKVRNGEGVQLRTDLLTLGDPEQEYIRLQLSSLNAARVRLNQLARVSVIGPDTTVYPGHIASLNPQAILPDQTRQGNSRQSDQATVPATVRLNKPTRALIPGSQVNVEIVLAQKQNVVSLSPEAVQSMEKNPFVWVKDPQGRAQKRSVSLGLEGLLAIEIASGLNPGDQVILPPPEPPLREGTPVVKGEG
jgi:HlyD family secretion protein